MIYLDNAATSGTKPEIVRRTVNYCLKNLNANAGRGGHKLALELSQLIYLTRQKICKLLNMRETSNVIFTYNCTYALNTAILGTIKQGGHIITSVCEHNSVLRPLNELRDKGIVEIDYLVPDINGNIYAEQVSRKIKSNTYMLILSHVSNVTGYTVNLNELGSCAKKHNLLFVVDCAQSIGHIDIDMTKAKIDMLAFPAHKGLHSVQGCGVLCINSEMQIKPIIYGGTGTESNNLLQPTVLPDSLEAGTANSTAIIATASAIDYHNANKKENYKKLNTLNNYLVEKLSTLNGVRVYSVPNNCGITSFNIADYDTQTVCNILSESYNIAVRGGLHCAPLMHKHLNTEATGLIRVSLSHFNSYNDIDAFIYALKLITKQ